MNTEDFNFFIRVVDLGSISKAAKEANISVSVASQRVQRLEQQLKIRLLHRTTRKLSLTDEGQTLLKYGRIWLNDFSNLTETLQNKSDQLIGTLKITASTTFATHVLTSVITQFSNLHPELHVFLDLNDQNVDLTENGIDIAIRIGKLKNSTLIAKQLSSNKRLLCASPLYIEKYGIPKTLEELKHHTCILQFHQQGISDIWQFIQTNGNLKSVKISGNFVSNSGEAIRQACLNGLGISNHSIWHVADDIEQGKLVHVLNDFTVEPTEIYAVIPERKLVPPKVRAFILYLEHYFQNDYPWLKA